MRIGILSDTHDQVARTRRAVERLVAEGAETLLHCGDLTGAEVVTECSLLPLFFVIGNNDYDEGLLRRTAAVTGAVCLGRGGELELGGKRIALTHGDSLTEMRRLSARAPDYLLFGHSHQRLDERDGPVRLINPGALHRATNWTVALLDLATEELSVLKIS